VTDSLVFSHQRRTSLENRRVGSCISGFGTCSAFTSITAYMIAKSPMRFPTPKVPADSLPPLLLRLLPGGAIQFPGGTCTHRGPAPFTAHSSGRLAVVQPGRGNWEIFRKKCSEGVLLTVSESEAGFYGT